MLPEIEPDEMQETRRATDTLLETSGYGKSGRAISEINMLMFWYMFRQEMELLISLIGDPGGNFSIRIDRAHPSSNELRTVFDLLTRDRLCDLVLETINGVKRDKKQTPVKTFQLVQESGIQKIKVLFEDRSKDKPLGIATTSSTDKICA